MLGNLIEGTTKGVEAWGGYQATKTWRLSGGAVYLDQDLQRKPGSLDVTGPSALGNDPAYQWQLRSTTNLTDRHEFDVIVRGVGALPNPVVPAYTAVDARLGWRAQRNMELSLTLQNLVDERHPEFGSAATRSEYGRGLFLKLVWRM